LFCLPSTDLPSLATAAPGTMPSSARGGGTYRRSAQREEIVRVLRTSLAAAQTEAVKIGVLGDQSSAYSDLGGKGSVIAAEMAAEDFGKSVLGKPIEIVSADHQNKPEIGANIARRWFDRDGVLMITDLTNSAVALAVQNVAKEKKRIDLVTSTATTALTNEACSPYGVHWTFDSYALSVGTAKTLVQQ